MSPRSGLKLGTPLSLKMSPFPKKMNGGSKLTRGYPPILSVDPHAYGEGGVRVESFEGTKGNIPL